MASSPAHTSSNDMPRNSPTSSQIENATAERPMAGQK